MLAASVSLVREGANSNHLHSAASMSGDSRIISISHLHANMLIMIIWSNY